GYLKSDLDSETRVETLITISKAEINMGHFPEALDLLQESLKLSRQFSNPKATIAALITQTIIHVSQGHWAKLNEVLTEAFKLANESGNLKEYGQALSIYAGFERMRGFQDSARSHYELACQLLERAGDNRELAIALNNLADLEITQGNLSKGMHLLQQTLFHERTVGDPRNVAFVLTLMGRVSLLSGDLAKAEESFQAAFDLASPDGSRTPLRLYFVLCNMADLERKRGHLEEALQLAKEAISLLEKAEISGIDLAYAWGMVTSLLLEMRKHPQAEEALTTTEILCSSLEFAEGIISNILLRGTLELQKGNLGTAQDFLEKAREESEEKKFLEVQIQAELALANLFLQKLQLDPNKLVRETAAAYLLRASRLAAKTALDPWKLEAQIIEAVAHSLNFRYEEAMKILRYVEATARSLELNLIEEKARKIKGPVRVQMRVLGVPTKLDEEMLDYISHAQEYITEAQSALRIPLERP
ncbi:MAG: tetratricopeptide repeat protein, partial [Candidatus Heimdallarchaeota archaeon]